MIRFLKITFLSFFIATTSAIAGSDGKLELSKKINLLKIALNPKQSNICIESGIR